MNIRQLEAFKATMTAKTTIGAAELLGVSQPAVSRLLGQLETSLSVTLFDRSGGHLNPTPEALLLHEEVLRAFVSIDKIREIAREMQVANSGMVSAASLPMLAMDFMPSAIARFTASRPESRISLRIQMSPRIEELVASQLVDVGIAEYPFDRSGIEIEEFCSAHYLMAVPSHHRLAQKARLTPEDLRDERYISITHNHLGRQLADQIFDRYGVKRRIVLEAQLFSTIANMVGKGLGIGLIDPFTAFDFREHPGVRSIPFEPAVSLRLGMLYPTHRSPSRVAREFISSLKASRRDVLRQIDDIFHRN
ncbi:LysR substrate-binding domain-containing protein [Mesorhizobium sp. B2-6-4]|uniref:LysR substrate-binding domain-containing protein n=1 Tax=Mesorhizobium sp. B2-6-4 TaxID=2589913 RepID=UPI0015E2D812|nr:LysR substrate-binding domain-containing protein [Mesorhizobium sp. B2-6-4]